MTAVSATVPGTADRTRLPRVAWVRQRIEGPVVADVSAEVSAGLAALPLAAKVRRGDTVAVALGSRGISHLDGVARTVVDHLRSLGAEPFVVPAMGSHGGATATGQQAVLAGYGLTEATLGCPVRSGMEVVDLGPARRGFPLWQDALAAAADHVVVVNRVKPHTLFSAPFESGLVKMLMIGLGKRDGAATIHNAVIEHGWGSVVDEVAPLLIDRTRLLAGVALVERADERTAVVSVLPPERWLTDEPLLLDQARSLMPRIPFSPVDLLLLDRIGKNISGAGLDTNVVGRKEGHHPPTHGETPAVQFIAVRGLTAETRGNAVGVGLAELARSRVIREMDVAVTRLNALTAGDLPGAMLPLDYETDAEIMTAALSMIGLRPPERARMVWARDTLRLGRTLCSEALLDEAAVRDDLEVIGAPFDLPLDSEGNLPDDLTSVPGYE